MYKYSYSFNLKSDWCVRRGKLCICTCNKKNKELGRNSVKIRNFKERSRNTPTLIVR